jgi:hypothetical protein
VRLAPAGGRYGSSKLDRSETIQTQLQILQAYTEGKMKRYGLMFSVNGGAFALAKFSADKGVDINPAVIASGAIFFTVLMTLDIWMFGIAMRTQFEEIQEGLFGQHGRFILLGLALLLISAWALAAGFQLADWTRTGGVLFLSALWLIKAHRDIVKRFERRKREAAKPAATLP